MQATEYLMEKVIEYSVEQAIEYSMGQAKNERQEQVTRQEIVYLEAFVDEAGLKRSIHFFAAAALTPELDASLLFVVGRSLGLVQKRCAGL